MLNKMVTLEFLDGVPGVLCFLVGSVTFVMLHLPEIDYVSGLLTCKAQICCEWGSSAQ